MFLYNMWLLEVLRVVCLSPTVLISLSLSIPLSLTQICGFVNAISPVGNDQQNLMAFRFSAFNPILDPWIFIIFRKAVFNHIREFLHCCFPRDAVKTAAQSSLSFPLEAGNVKQSPSIKSQIYCSLPQWTTPRTTVYEIYHETWKPGKSDWMCQVVLEPNRKALTSRGPVKMYDVSWWWRGNIL